MNTRIGKTFMTLYENADLQPGDIFNSEGKEILIGHVNKNGGVCDDCMFEDNKAILIKNILEKT